jgi:dienelactone hydrolase
MGRLLSFLLLAVLAASASAQESPVKAIKEGGHVYADGDQKLEGFFAYDEAVPGKRPAVLIVHDWNGLDAYEQSRARQLAELGYVAFAVDIYGQGVRPKDAKESAAEAAKYRGDIPLFRRRLTLGLEELRKHPLVDASRIAAIGYCFGGTGVIELARTGADFRVAVSFHGSLTLAPADASSIRAALLILHGDDDPLVPPSAVDAFLKEMREARVTYQFIAYSGAVHSFTVPTAGDDPSRGSAYNAEADRSSWEHMKQFFRERL